MKHLPLLLALPLLAACATTALPEEEDLQTRPVAQGECDTDGVQDRIGERATAEMGGEVLRETGAETLRWIPPRSAVTMDFRPDRLNIEYDDSFIVTRIRCG